MSSKTTLKRRNKMRDFSCSTHVKEDHKGPIYSVKFCIGYGEPYSNYFATAGHNQIRVYKCSENTQRTIECVQAYVDSDESECFYALEWMIPDFESGSDAPLVVAAGKSSVVKIVNCSEERMTRTLMGHSEAINDIVRHTTADHILFTASKDESIKMWNVNTCICVASFAGDKGHREDVLSVCVHDYGNCFASAGMDNTIKIWALDTEYIIKTMELSSKSKSKKRPFETLEIQFPCFSTRHVHSDYVDCVRWVGDHLISKSTKNQLKLWRPAIHRCKDTVTILETYAVPSTSIWFLRMDLDMRREYIAVGNTAGEVYLWKLEGDSVEDKTKPPVSSETKAKRRRRKLTHPHGRVTSMRAVAFSSNAETLICVCDDSSVLRYDMKK